MKKNVLKKTLFISFIIISLMVVFSIMLKYDVEGEQSMPYSISKVLIVSTVDGQKNEDQENIWNIGITQVNDLYIYLDKAKNNNEIIKEVRLENFNIYNGPQKGTVKLLRPTGDLNSLYLYSEGDYLKEGITYTGAVIDDLKSLEISNVGGVLGCRLILDDLGTFISNDINQEITYDGHLLKNLGIDIKELRYNVSFDIVILTSEDVSYKGTIEMRLPMEEVIEKGSSSMELSDFSNVIFKRI